MKTKDKKKTRDRKKAKSNRVLICICAFFKKHHYLFSKVGISILTLALAMVVLFFLLRLIPGDLVEQYTLNLMGSRALDHDAAYHLAVSMLHFDPNENVFKAFGRYCSGLFKGDLGTSAIETGVSANSLIVARLPWTLFISSCALFINFFLGTAIGGFVAQRRNGLASKAASAYIALSGSIPDYLVALLLVIIFAYQLKWFPAQNNYDAFSVTPGFNLPFLLNVLKHGFLPIFTCVLSHTGGWIMVMRGSCVGVLGEDYIMAARARGLSLHTIRKRYMRRNALLPLVASLGTSFGALFGGSVLLESIFNYPGLGLEISRRILAKDYMVVQGLIFFSAFMVIMINLLVDLIYPWIDPRVRRE